MTKILILFITFAANFTALYSQCGCMAGASVGGITPFSGTGTIGVLDEDDFRAISFVTYSQGENFYEGNKNIGKGTINKFQTTFLGLILGYGITDDMTFETELYAFPQKTQDFYDYSLSGSGMSHLALNLKYNVISLSKSDFEWTLGLGGKVPFSTGDDNLPLHIQSSTGAFGAIAQSFIHQGFRSSGINIIFASRLETNFENTNQYRYGSSIINSLFVSKNLIDNFNFILEFRSDIRLKDQLYGDDLTDTGSNSIILAPQLSYHTGEFNFSVFYDYIAQNYYNGRQLARDYSVGTVVSWTIGL